MLSSLLRILCCCCSTEPEPSINDEQARLLRFQIPTIPSQPVQVQESDYQQRMVTIVRAMEGKMVNVSSRLPFNLYNRVIHDSMSRSPSRSFGYDDLGGFEHGDEDTYSFLSHQQQKQAYEHRYPVYYQNSPSRSPERLGSTTTDHDAERPAAILNLRLVNVTENERGRARERTTKPTGFGGGAVESTKQNSPTIPTNAEEPDTPSSAPRFELELMDPNEVVLSSWNDSPLPPSSTRP